jgi:hypothetical protein
MVAKQDHTLGGKSFTGYRLGQVQVDTLYGCQRTVAAIQARGKSQSEAKAAGLIAVGCDAARRPLMCI